VRLASVREAVAAIPDGATVAVDGFTLMGVAEALYEGIEETFRTTGHPRDLVIVHAAGQSNRKIGFEHFAVEGLARRIVGSHWGLMPRMSTFLGKDLAEAVCLPQGQISSLYRAIAAGRPGNLSRIGLGTFVDPRIEAGKVNQSARDHAPDYVGLARLACEVGEDVPQAATCASVLELLDRMEAFAADYEEPARPPGSHVLRPFRGVALVIAAAAVALTPDVPLPEVGDRAGVAERQA